MFETREYLKVTNSPLYHGVMFLSFLIAVKLLPWFESFASKYVAQNTVLTGATFLLAYVAATYVLPEVGFMIIKTTTED